MLCTYVHNIWALVMCDGIIDNFLKLLTTFWSYWWFLLSIIQGSDVIYIHTQVHNISKYIMYIIISEAPDSFLKSFNDFFVFSKQFAIHIIFFWKNNFNEIVIIVFFDKIIITFFVKIMILYITNHNHFSEQSWFFLLLIIFWNYL